MSTTTNDDSQTYCIETTISTGSIEDPVTGEKHEIADGEIDVSRPDSAAALVDTQQHLAFAGDGPTDGAVHAAQKERFEFAESDVCMAFAEDHYLTFEEMNLDPANGFDPEADPAYNDPRMKAQTAYNDLQENGRDSEGEYLRALPSTSDQEEFVTFLRKKGLIDNE